MSEKTQDRVRAIRAMTGMSQRRFAKEYGIPRRTVEDWEADKSTPSEYVLNLLERCVKADRT